MLKESVLPLSSLVLGRISGRSRREVVSSALSLARSAQAERDNESCFFHKESATQGDPESAFVAARESSDSSLAQFVQREAP
ncbi:hypothetical protein EVAR_27046_1 [Eumeta japonica]|uniref:Uncharacterized protein n=1 Tax=Eumeta variegata TaxID=151549 RepID=A0A4C1WGS7_EUMVA|nr:hypothetical protein EVAR_27046_1 [Eumeta japonica]